MYLINANFSLLKVVGDLDEDKRKEIQRTFPELSQFSTMGSGVVFRNQSRALMVSPAQITYITNGDSNAVDLSDVSNILIRAYNAVHLSGTVGIAMKFEGLSDSFPTSQLSASKVPVRNIVEGLGARGVGYRFMIDSPGYRGDVNIEPYLRDDSRIYINVELAQDQVLTGPDDIAGQLDKMWQYGNEHVPAAALEFFHEMGG